MQIHVTRPSLPPMEEYVEEIQTIWSSHRLTNMGEKHCEFQARLETFLGCPHVTLFTNGHLALESVIACMGFPPGSEIITTPFTFASTTHAIVRNGLTPVFCDIDPVDYTMDTAKIEALITEKTVALLPVHVYGHLCDTEALDRLAKRYGLKVIYDAAHAFAVTKNGISAACFGDASVFSFHATKVFHTIEGGAVCFRDECLVGNLDALKNFGLQDAEKVPLVGGNAKMSEFQAAMGICNLRHLAEEIEARKTVFLQYSTLLSGIPGITVPSPQPGVTSNYAYYPVVFDGFRKSRDTVFAALADEDIYARKYFFPLTSNFECYANSAGAGTGKTPVAEYIADRVLTLPLYAGLPPEEIDRICQIITGG